MKSIDIKIVRAGAPLAALSSAKEIAKLKKSSVSIDMLEGIEMTVQPESSCIDLLHTYNLEKEVQSLKEQIKRIQESITDEEVPKM